MPPMDPPATASQAGTPRWSMSWRWASTMSAMVMTGNGARRVWRPGIRSRARPRRAPATADHVGTDDEILVRVEGFPRPHHGIPPTGACGSPATTRPRGRRPSERATGGWRSPPCHRQAAIGLIGERDGAQLLAGGQNQPVKSEGVSLHLSQGFDHAQRRARRGVLPSSALHGWSMSARMSSMCSIPTERRIKSGVTPVAFCSSTDSWEWVVVAG
jgi:hypothetical protein